MKLLRPLNLLDIPLSLTELLFMCPVYSKFHRLLLLMCSIDPFLLQDPWLTHHTPKKKEGRRKEKEGRRKKKEGRRNKKECRRMKVGERRRKVEKRRRKVE